ncbi:endonuclease [Flavobacterium sp. SUN052]|uniref:endonuclease n=1 Tax=Flavobacterium sp. SUN052 TaxID=3002441 RepID=UPI00237E805E|nr:endonuclease [Flavobacterium sp. SUN052]MEC4005868.1 endonuclease [Flavobacterium sp. SUN052]
MLKKSIVIITLFLCGILHSQVVINELDADTPSTDNLEFIELKSTSPNFALDGYVLVFFNGLTTGTGNLSYFAIDLDNYTTDINGIIHFGNSQVSPTPAIIIPSATIQNGPDAIGLYLGNASDFPLNSVANTTGLIDAIAYSNSATTQPTALMSALGISICTNENQTNLASTKSIQRKVDGTYEVKTPTPGMNNDGSGIVLTYLTLSTNVTNISEGQNLTITYNSTQPITGNDLVINFSLSNSGFNTADYSGLTNVTIPVGATVGSTIIQILNDGLNEGDEELKIVANSIPSNYSLYNNNLIVRVNDINFQVLPFGTPANPTHGNVSSTAPTGYYSSLEGLSGTALKQAIQNIIANPSIVRVHNYDDVWDILKKADQNPENSNQVWLIYTETARSKLDAQSGNSIIGKWNREHIYCQSRGGYSVGTDYLTPFADGINIWTATTGANDIGAGVCDAHHIRAVDGQENSSRNNRNYGVDYNGPTGTPTTTWKGDVARALFYMAVRYSSLNVVNGNPTDGTIGQIGDLTTLLSWNHSDSSDDFEMNRNNYIYTWQLNRNPFIDYPDLADYVWGIHANDVWYAALSNTNFSTSKVIIYPNPAKDNFSITGLSNDTSVALYSILGTKLFEQNVSEQGTFDISNYNSGIYILKITSDGTTIERKIIKE